jgi:hypothetical protein
MSNVKAIIFRDVMDFTDASVRVTDDNLFYAVDLVVAVTGKNNNHAAKMIRDLSEEAFSKDNFEERQLCNR